MTFHPGKGRHSISGCPSPATPGYIPEMSVDPAGPESSLQTKTKLRSLRVIVNPRQSCCQRCPSWFRTYFSFFFFCTKGKRSWRLWCLSAGNVKLLIRMPVSCVKRKKHHHLLLWWCQMFGCSLVLPPFLPSRPLLKWTLHLWVPLLLQAKFSIFPG